MSVAGVSSEREKARPAAPAARARSRRVRALRSFVAVLSGVAAFAAFQLGLAAVVEIRMPEIRDPFYGRRLHLVQNSLHAKHAKPWTVLMMGSSHVQAAFRVGKGEEEAWTKILDHRVATFNFATPGAGLLTELLTWNRLRRDGVRPNLLLVEVCPPLLGVPAPRDYNEVCLPTGRLSWPDLPLVERYAGNIRKGVRRDFLESWPMAGYTHRLGLISLVRPDLLPPDFRLAAKEAQDERGVGEFFDAPVTSERRLNATQYARQDYHGCFVDFHMGGLQCQALRELLASCRKEKVSVALVVMPEGPTFRSWYPPGTWETVKEWLTQVSREYDAPLVNAREWIDDETDFMDSHHLIPSGQAKFKERLARECIFPLLRRTQDKEPYAARLP